MTEEDQSAEPPKIDQELMKEALHEILNDIPAFRALAQCGRGEETDGGSQTEATGFSSNTSNAKGKNAKAV